MSEQKRQEIETITYGVMETIILSTHNSALSTSKWIYCDRYH
ncbi:hypothetical protein [Nostoc sp. FACHB-110]|nr:hypothetical protein [Nostoc sp. FACHB-110]